MLNRPKYNAKKFEADGIKWDSKREYKRWLDLVAMQKRGEICLLERQVPFVLHDAYVNGNGKKIREIKYIADFTYFKTANNDVAEFMTVEDSKGFRKLPAYLIKIKLFEKRYYPLTITEV